MKELAGKHALFIVENITVPFDKRVWREALALHDSGAEVSVICPMQDDYVNKYEVLEGINIYRFYLGYSNGSKKGYIFEYISAFIKIFYLVNKVMLTERNIDSVHAANPPDIFWPIAYYLKLFGVKFIFDEHDLTPETFLSKFNVTGLKGEIILKTLRLFQYLSYRAADAVIATNETYKVKACNIYAGNAEKITIVRNGPDTRKFQRGPQNLSLKRARTHMFAYIGIMGTQDGVDYIINSAYYLINHKKFTDFIIYLIGSGDEIERLRELVREYGLQDYIVFTGRIPDEPAIEILSTADICLSPDPYNQLNDSSTMNKVMEYMALGKPIVSFNLKESKYSAGSAAIYTENNDSAAFAEGILRLIADSEVREEMGRVGLGRIREIFCWQKQIDNLIAVYKKIYKITGS